MITYEPDIVTRGLDVVFCGLNPAASAAAAGHNFSSRSNRFWKVLHRAGFTDVPLQAHEERRLLDYGCGITAVVGRATQRADEVSPEEFKAARAEFKNQDSALCPALDRLCRQARRVGDDRAASSRLGSASQGSRRDDGLDSAQSEQPQQELYARCSRRSLHEFRTTLFGDAQARTPLEPVSKVPVVNRRQPGTAFGNRQEPFSLGGSNRSFCPQRGHCLESVARTQ